MQRQVLYKYIMPEHKLGQNECLSSVYILIQWPQRLCNVLLGLARKRFLLKEALSVPRERGKETSWALSLLCNMCLCIWHRRAVFQRCPPSVEEMGCTVPSDAHVCCCCGCFLIWCQAYNEQVGHHRFVPSSSSRQENVSNLTSSFSLTSLSLSSFCSSSGKSLKVGRPPAFTTATSLVPASPFFNTYNSSSLLSTAWAATEWNMSRFNIRQIMGEAVCHLSTCCAPLTNSVQLWCVSSSFLLQTVGVLEKFFMNSCVWIPIDLPQVHMQRWRRIFSGVGGVGWSYRGSGSNPREVLPFFWCVAEVPPRPHLHLHLHAPSTLPTRHHWL